MEEKYDKLLNDLCLCGCGAPYYVINMMCNYLKETEKHNKRAKSNEDWNTVYEDWNNYKEKYIEENKELLFEFMLHFLNEKNYLEHGTSIYSSWITNKGKKLISDFKEIDEDII